MSGFSVPAFQDPPWFYLLFSPWVTTFLPSFIFRANSLAPSDTCSYLAVYLFPFSGIWESTLRGKGAVSSLTSPGCTGVLWASGFPWPGLCPGAFMQRDERPWNDKGDLFQHCLDVGQGIFLL